MATSSQHPVATKRMVIGHITVCQGCCCGHVERGRPEVPVEWLKKEWRQRGLLKNIQLTFSGCLGPCDLPNVVTVASSGGSIWLGNVRHFRQYLALVDWALLTKAAESFLPLPQEFDELRFDPFRLTEPVEKSEVVVENAL